MKLILALSLIFTSFIALAGDHSLTNFKGGDVELKAADHAVAGSVKGHLIFASLSEETGVTNFTAKKDGKLINLEIKRLASGSFGVETNTLSVLFKKLVREENKFIFTVNGEEIAIDIKADDFSNNHYINPAYTFHFKDKDLTVKLEKGEACYNFSAHLIAMILTAYSL
jgi:hypothetical protein